MPIEIAPVDRGFRIWLDRDSLIRIQKALEQREDVDDQDLAYAIERKLAEHPALDD